jgi:hypothetical protein
VSFNKQTINFQKLGKTRERKDIFHSLSRNSKYSRNFSCPKQLPTRKLFWKETGMFLAVHLLQVNSPSLILSNKRSTGEDYLFGRRKKFAALFLTFHVQHGSSGQALRKQTSKQPPQIWVRNNT